MWQTQMKPDDLVPPPSFGKLHGMHENRWLKLRAKAQFGPLPTPEDKWAFIRPIEDSFNSHMARIYTHTAIYPI